MPLPAVRSGQRRSVVLVLQGDLGNQLFEWAFGEELRHRGTRVIVDASRCFRDQGLEIGPLLEGWPRLPDAFGVATAAAYRNDWVSRWPGYVVESQFGFDPHLLERAQAGRCVVGYFHSPVYFAPHADEVRQRVLAFASDALTRDGRAVRRYLSEHPDFVAVHVPPDEALLPSQRAGRRAQVVRDLDQEWQQLRRRGFAWRVWFGDDLGWVSQDLAGPGDLFVNESLMTRREGELALMAACRGRLLSSSTLSWWGGWLGQQPATGGVVVTHRRWEADDLVCDGWSAA